MIDIIQLILDTLGFWGTFWLCVLLILTHGGVFYVPRRYRSWRVANGRDDRNGNGDDCHPGKAGMAVLKKIEKAVEELNRQSTSNGEAINMVIKRFEAFKFEMEPLVRKHGEQIAHIEGLLGKTKQ